LAVVVLAEIIHGPGKTRPDCVSLNSPEFRRKSWRSAEVWRLQLRHRG